MAKPESIELPGTEPIPILYEDRSVLAIDKPRGWMLAPLAWRHTQRNLQAALDSSIAARDFWARSRNLRFLRAVHRLDADTSGVLLLVKSPGALNAYSELFETRQMEKAYLAVVVGKPKQREWTCWLKLASDANQAGRMKVDSRHGKPAETHFHLLQAGEKASLVEARPTTGRTHQIRVHLAAGGHPVVGDELYGPAGANADATLGLRAVELAYMDPFTRRPVRVRAPTRQFLREYGFPSLTSVREEVGRTGDGTNTTS